MFGNKPSLVNTNMVIILYSRTCMIYLHIYLVPVVFTRIEYLIVMS